jgi:hypothetical protein
MKRRIVIALLALAVAGQASAKEEKGKAEKDAKGSDEDRSIDEKTLLGETITYKNLSVVPVLAKTAPKDAKQYLVLDEAFDKKLVKVTEREGGDSVNELTLENKSDKALFLMAGEVILGGKQDRIIGKNTVIQPKEKVTVPVFCVEHGRWSEEKGSKEFRSGKSMAHTKLRNEANFKAQQDVWNEVEKKTKARKVETDTQTYRTVTNKDSVDKAVAPYAKEIGPKVDKVEGADRMIGFVVIVNGKIVGMETFTSPELFGKVKDKLLRSYYVEAVDIPEDKEAAKRTIKSGEIREYSKKGADKPKKKVLERKAGDAVTSNFDDEEVMGTDVVEAAPASEVQPEVYKSINTK